MVFQNLSPVVLSVNIEFFPHRAQRLPMLKVCKTIQYPTYTSFSANKN